MGSGRWDADKWSNYTRSTKSKPVHAIYHHTTTKGTVLDPYGVALRESRDSVDNPNSTPVILGLDLTGSMRSVLDYLAKEGLGTLITEILERKPITDPAIALMCFGDAHCDSEPLQVSQFESSNVLVQQLEHLVFQGGGGNSSESEDLVWYFATKHTATDSFEKRSKPGYLLTFGDEEFPTGLTAAQIQQFVGDGCSEDYPATECLNMARRTWEIYHFIIEEGSYASSYLKQTQKSWQEHLGQHVISVKDHRKLAEIAVSVIQVAEGADKKTVTDSWGGDTSVVVSHAVGSLPSTSVKAERGVVRLS